MGNQRKLLEIGLRNGGHIAGSHLDKSQLAGAQYDISYDTLPAEDTATRRPVRVVGLSALSDPTYIDVWDVPSGPYGTVL